MSSFLEELNTALEAEIERAAEYEYQQVLYRARNLAIDAGMERAEDQDLILASLAPAKRRILQQTRQRFLARAFDAVVTLQPLK